MNTLRELTLGRLLAQFRDRAGMPAKDVLLHLPISASPSWSAPRLSQVEQDSSKRIDRETLKLFADLYEVTQTEYTYLLRAADYEAAPREIERLRAWFNERHDASNPATATPACVLDYHYRVVCWNEAFASLYGTDDDGHVLVRPMVSFFALLYHPASPLRSKLEPASWMSLTQRSMAFFWRGTAPLEQRRWNPGGLEWVNELRNNAAERLGLCDEAAEQFRVDLNRAIAAATQSLRAPALQVTVDGFVDSIVLADERERRRLIIEDLPDGRFNLLSWFRF